MDRPPSNSEQSRGWAPHDGLYPNVLQRPDTRAALARRDIAVVFRLLQRFGMSQRAIAARTGQSQSEVSEILAGRRKVMSYELLVRIAQGLEIPFGWLGLAYDAETARFIALSRGTGKR